MKTAIVIICYNAHDLFLKQIERINRHCKDSFEVIVIDNSTNEESIVAIKYFSDKIGLKHCRTQASSQNSSASHSFAANYAYNKYKDEYDYFLFLDHDCFPVKDFSVEQTLGEKTFAGIGQLKKGIKYLWPGCMMFKSIDGIDFSPNHELGLDTGGNNYKLITQDNTVDFSESHIQNQEFTKSQHDFYAMINNGMFMHFVAGSNWSNKEHHEERLNSLLNIISHFSKCGF